jgi:uncharacterized membrane protein YphA (DoxX/SURF4 family)
MCWLSHTYIPTYTIILAIVYEHNGNVLLECQDGIAWLDNFILFSVFGIGRFNADDKIIRLASRSESHQH